MFRCLDVVIGFDEQTLEACFDILSDIAGLRKGITVAYGKGDVELLTQSSV